MFIVVEAPCAGLPHESGLYQGVFIGGKGIPSGPGSDCGKDKAKTGKEALEVKAGLLIKIQPRQVVGKNQQGRVDKEDDVVQFHDRILKGWHVNICTKKGIIRITKTLEN